MADDQLVLGSDWRATVLVAVAVALPVLILLQLEDDTQPIEQVASVTGLIAYVIVLAAALLVYFCWRVSRDDATGWIAAAMALAAVQGVALQARSLSDAGGVARSGDWQMIVHTGLISVVVLLAIAAQRRSLAVDPLAMGVVLGAVFSLARWQLASSPWQFDTRSWQTVSYRSAIAVACVLLVLALLAIPTLPRWVRVQLSATATLLVIGYQMSFPYPEGEVRSGIAIVTYLLAAVVVGATGFTMLRGVLHEERAAVRELQERLRRLESLARVDKARLHEIGATISGIRSASHLLETDPDLQPSRRSNLIQMMRQESARLERLLDRRTRAAPGELDVDQVIAPIVERQLAAGQRVTWTPSGLRAWGRPDELAEEVSILLDNAARHAPGADVAVSARPTGAAIEIVVADSGPGVPPKDVARVFDWGHSGERSTGTGIGLAVARRMLQEVGGSLRYEPGEPGSRFVLRLHRSDPELPS